MFRYKLRTLLIAVTMVSATCAYARLYLTRTQSISSLGEVDVRLFRTLFEYHLFRPAAAIESAITGRHVYAGFVRAAKADPSTIEAYYNQTKR